MWDLSTPWVELVLRASAIFIGLFILFKIWGKKHFGEMTAFDFIILLIMSEAVQNSLVDGDESVTGGLIVIATFMVLTSLMNILSFYSRKAEKFFSGTPKVIIRDGKLMEEVLKKERISLQELLEQIRENGVLHLKDIGLAVLEANGKISVIKKEDTNNMTLQKMKDVFKPMSGGFYERRKKEHS
ncbi:MAG: DUF421 domain-containing protein [Bdellovibrionales bacterium]|nr:DUF421 domain-containing protein [Bdellovibrionales bacterium]